MKTVHIQIECEELPLKMHEFIDCKCDDSDHECIVILAKVLVEALRQRAGMTREEFNEYMSKMMFEYLSTKGGDTNGR